MMELIQAATQSQSNEQRNQAEKTLISMRDQNPNQFFQSTAEVFKSSTTQSSIREAAGTILAASIVVKRQNHQYLWDSLDGNEKNAMKNSILTVMIDIERNVRRAAANIVSAICFVELPRNEWEGIMQKICSNINNQNPIIRQVSILALGFICERVRDITNFQFPLSTQEAIFAGIVLGLKQNDPNLINVTLKALRDSIGSLSNLFENANNREFLLKQAGDMVRSQQYSVLGLQILAEFVKSNYEFIGSIMNDLFSLLLPFIKATNNENVCIAATEIWENLAAEYGNQNDKNIENHISGETGTNIVKALLENLCVMDDGDEETNEINESTSKALETIFDNGSVEYKDLVLEFVGNTITQDNWRFKQASVKAFSLLLFGLPKAECRTLVENSIQNFLALLNDNSVTVQYVTIHSLMSITEICGGCILKKPNFLLYLDAILRFRTKSENFFKDICKIIENLCQAAKQQSLNTFYQIAEKLVEVLMETCLNVQSEMIIINVGISTIMSIIEVAKNQTVSLKYIQFVLENFHNLKSVGDREKRDLLRSCFFTIVQTCLISLRKSNNIHLDQLSNVYQLITTHFQEVGDVSHDGFYAASALSYYFYNDLRFLDDFWKYIIHALKKPDEPALFKATLSCISDFALSYRQKMKDKLESFVPNLIGLVHEPTYNRDLKLDILNCLSEVFLNCGQSAIGFLENFMRVIMLCCEGAVEMVKTDFAYSQTLKDVIVDTLMCVLHGMNADQSTTCQELEPYIINIFTFGKMSCDRSVRPTVSYISKVLLLLADFSHIYPGTVRPKLSGQPFIIDLITTLQKHNQNHEYSKIIKYGKQHLK